MENLWKHTDNCCTFNTYNGKTSHKQHCEYLVAPDWHMQVFSKKDIHVNDRMLLLLLLLPVLHDYSATV